MKVKFENRQFEERRFANQFDPLPAEVWKEEKLALVQDDEAGNVVVTKVTDANVEALKKEHKHAWAEYEASLAPAEAATELAVEEDEAEPEKAPKKKGLFGKRK